MNDNNNVSPYKATGNLNTTISNPSANINDTMNVNIENASLNMQTNSINPTNNNVQNNIINELHDNTDIYDSLHFSSLMELIIKNSKEIIDSKKDYVENLSPRTKIIIEKGKRIKERAEDVEKFFKNKSVYLCRRLMK